MATIKDLAEQYGLEDYEQLLGGYPNAEKFITGLKDAAVRSVPTTEQMRDPNFIIDTAGLGGAIKAYHGSPHLFDRFDMSKIGTGEGAQAYGHGLYFAENPMVADDYLREFKSNKNQDATIYETNLTWPDKNKEQLDPLNKKHFLDYKKDFSKQSKYVQDAIKNAAKKRNEDPLYKGPFISGHVRKTGEDLLNLYGEDDLLQEGIPGVRYLDEGSRGLGKKTHNLVLFSDEYPEITKRAGSLDELQEKNLNKRLIEKYLSEGKLSPDDMAQYEQNALAMETPLLQRYNVENADAQGGTFLSRAIDRGYDPNDIYTTNSVDEWLSSIKKKEDVGNYGGMFDGIFLLNGSEGGSRGYDFDHQFIANPNKIANTRDKDLDFNKTMSFLKKEYGHELNDDELSRLYDLTAYDDDIWDGGENVLSKLNDEYNDLGRASWEAQNIRGKLAKDQGFDLIKMRDEEGTSYFAPHGSKIKSTLAAFDPLRKNSSSIMASGLLGDLALKYANDEDQGYAEGGSVDKDSLQLNKPRRTPNHPTKSHIVKTMVDGKEKIIRFGEQGAETAGKPKEGESDRMTAKRESFKARHAKNIAKGPSSAAYWANKVKWAEGGEVDIRDDEGYLDDLNRLKKAYERSNFGPNDSVIASTIHHPIEAAKRAKDSLMRSIDAAAGVPREILDESSAFPFGIAPSMDEQAQAGLDLAGLMQTGAMPFAPESAGGTLGTLHKFRIGDLGYDLRFDDRKLEQDKLQNMVLQLSRPENEKRIISLANYEGYPWVTTMSDRTNVGNLHYINDRPVDVDLQGGQDYMFNNPGQVWASAQAPVNAIMKYGRELSERAGGLDPLYMPWRMAPTGGDYANMTGETMLKYMRSNMNKKEQRAVNKGIKDFIPDFKGIESEEGIDQFRNAPDKVRKALKNHLDTKYRNAGGISIGEARLAVADPSQLLAPDTGLQNVGQIYIGNPIIQESGHRAYPRGVPGQGLGVLDRDVMAYDLMPEVAEYRGLIDLKNPRTTDIRALQMKPYGGIITDKILKNLGYAKGGEVKTLHDKYAEGGSVKTTPVSYGFEYDQMANSLGLNNINYGGLNSGSTKTTNDTTPVTSGLSALTDTPIEKASTTVDTPADATPKYKSPYYHAEFNPTGNLVYTTRPGTNPGMPDAVDRYQRDKDGNWHDYGAEGLVMYGDTPMTSRQNVELILKNAQQKADDILAAQRAMVVVNAMPFNPFHQSWNDTMADPLKDPNNPAYQARQNVLDWQKHLDTFEPYKPFTPQQYAKGGSVKDLHNKYEESDYGYGNRPDKTKKGLGYFGELERPDGTGVMTEYSIGVPINGKEMDVPTLVPTLTPDEIRLILHMQDGDDMPRSIVHKAIDHAHQRLSEGKPIFATEEDLYAHGGIVDVLHNDAIEQIMKAFMDSMADDEEPSAPAVSIEITTQNTETPRRGKIPKSIAREAKHG